MGLLAQESPWDAPLPPQPLPRALLAPAGGDFLATSAAPPADTRQLALAHAVARECLSCSPVTYKRDISCKYCRWTLPCEVLRASESLCCLVTSLFGRRGLRHRYSGAQSRHFSSPTAISTLHPDTLFPHVPKALWQPDPLSSPDASGFRGTDSADRSELA